MRRRVERVIMNLAVELTVGGEVLHTKTQDVSPFGMFVRLDRPIPIGTEVQLAIAPRARARSATRSPPR